METWLSRLRQTKALKMKMEEDKIEKGRNEQRNVLILSGAFTSIFTAYLAIQNLQSSLNQEEGLGVISLSSLYACVIISGILSPAIINFTGEKWSMVIAFSTHILYTGTNFYPKFYTLIPSSVLLGLAAGPLWTSQCVYVSEMSYSYADATGSDKHVILTKFNGFFFAMFETTQITGNLVSSLILQQGSYNSSDTNETVKYCGRNDCPTEVNATQFVEPEKNYVYMLLGVFLVCDVVGVVLAARFLPELKHSAGKVKTSALTAMTACGKGFTDLNLVLLIPLFMFMAMEQGVLWTEYTKSYISCTIGIQKIGFVMAAYGCSTAVFALTLSRVSKYTGRYALFLMAGLVNLGSLITMYVWIPTEDSETFIFLLPIIWGMAEGVWQTQSNALVGYLFPEKTDVAFAYYHTCKASGFTITFVYGNILCVSTKVIIALALLGISMLLYMVVEIRVKRKKNKTITKD